MSLRAVLATVVAAAFARAGAPNIVLLLADDLGYGDLSSRRAAARDAASTRSRSGRAVPLLLRGRVRVHAVARGAAHGVAAFRAGLAGASWSGASAMQPCSPGALPASLPILPELLDAARARASATCLVRPARDSFPRSRARRAPRSPTGRGVASVREPYGRQMAPRSGRRQAPDEPRLRRLARDPVLERQRLLVVALGVRLAVQPRPLPLMDGAHVVEAPVNLANLTRRMSDRAAGAIAADAANGSARSSCTSPSTTCTGRSSARRPFARALAATFVAALDQLDAAVGAIAGAVDAAGRRAHARALLRATTAPTCSTSRSAAAGRAARREVRHVGGRAARAAPRALAGHHRAGTDDRDRVGADLVPTILAPSPRRSTTTRPRARRRARTSRRSTASISRRRCSPCRVAAATRSSRP